MPVFRGGQPIPPSKSDYYQSLGTTSTFTHEFNGIPHPPPDLLHDHGPHSPPAPPTGFDDPKHKKEKKSLFRKSSNKSKIPPPPIHSPPQSPPLNGVLKHSSSTSGSDNQSNNNHHVLLDKRSNSGAKVHFAESVTDRSQTLKVSRTPKTSDMSWDNHSLRRPGPRGLSDLDNHVVETLSQKQARLQNG